MTHAVSVDLIAALEVLWRTVMKDLELAPSAKDGSQIGGPRDCASSQQNALETPGGDDPVAHRLRHEEVRIRLVAKETLVPAAG